MHFHYTAPHHRPPGNTAKQECGPGSARVEFRDSTALSLHTRPLPNHRAHSLCMQMHVGIQKRMFAGAAANRET